MPPIPRAAPATAAIANGAAPSQPEIIYARMWNCLIYLIFCCFLVHISTVTLFMWQFYVGVFKADDTTELTKSEDAASSVCNDYCEYFSLSELACLCVETGGDMTMMKMSANYSDNQQSLATIECQYKNWTYGNSPAYSKSYLDVCKHYSNNSAAFCTTCSTSTTCTTPTLSTMVKYLKLLVWTNLEIASLAVFVLTMVNMWIYFQFYTGKFLL